VTDAIKATMLLCGEVEIQGKDRENLLVLEAVDSDWSVHGGTYFVMPEAELAALREENKKRGNLLKRLEWSGFKMPELGEGPSGAYNFCPVCKAKRDSFMGATSYHEEGCELKAALGQEVTVTPNRP